VATKAIEYAICFKHNMISVNIREIWDPELPETGLVRELGRVHLS
jgi:hypothetical protein